MIICEWNQSSFKCYNLSVKDYNKQKLPPHPDRSWVPLRLLSEGYWEFFPRGLTGRGVKLTTHLHLEPKLKMRGATLPLPQYVFMAW